ncbi:MAG: SH3 domain-containing protein [Candidatus Omnitrophota bacterium]
MKKFIVVIAVVVAGVLGVALPGIAGKFPFEGRVNSEGINVRSGPNVSYEIIDRLKRDTQVKVVGERFDWYKIRPKKTTRCFINAKYIQRVNSQKGVVAGDRVNLRAKGAVSATIVGKVNRGHILKIVRSYAQWYEVAAPEELVAGWMHKRFVDYPKKEDKPAVVEASPEMPSEVQEVRENSGDNDRSDAPLATGLIYSRGIFAGSRGSHKLIVGKRVAYYLKGDRLLLHPFLRRNVAVYGKIINEEKKIPTIKVERIEAK